MVGIRTVDNKSERDWKTFDYINGGIRQQSEQLIGEVTARWSAAHDRDLSHRRKFPSYLSCTLVQLHVLIVDRIVVNAPIGWRNPCRHLALLENALHQAMHECAV